MKLAGMEQANWLSRESWGGELRSKRGHSHESEDRPFRIEGRKPRIRVLLVDDHRVLREGIAGLLKQEPDIEVVGQASDGVCAIEMARSLHPDVILMDVTMPRMSGIEATRRICHEMPGVRVVGLSMHEDQEMGAAMRRAGAADYLVKDGPSHTLVSAIRRN